jgi:hypothetical protein
LTVDSVDAATITLHGRATFQPIPTSTLPDNKATGSFVLSLECVQLPFWAARLRAVERPHVVVTFVAYTLWQRARWKSPSAATSGALSLPRFCYLRSVPKPRASRRRVAELSFVLRAILDDIAAAGGAKGRVHREALVLVDAFADGTTPAPETIAAARASIRAFTGRIGMGSSPDLLALSWVPTTLLLDTIEHGDDLTKGVLAQAQAAILGRPADAPQRVQALFDEARARVTIADDVPLPAPTCEVEPGALADDFPAIATAHLASRGARRSGKHADAEGTRAILEGAGHPAHAAVLAFEAAYGGLELFESDPDAPALLVGPYAVFSALRGYRALDGGLVPVAMACDDVYYALDAKGRGYTNAAMVEGVFRPSANDGRALLTQAVLWRCLVTHPKSFVTRDGKQGAAMAKERGLPRIAGATGKTERWWGSADGMRLVVEIDRGNGFDGPRTHASG